MIERPKCELCGLTLRPDGLCPAASCNGGLDAAGATWTVLAEADLEPVHCPTCARLLGWKSAAEMTDQERDQADASFQARVEAAQRPIIGGADVAEAFVPSGRVECSVCHGSRPPHVPAADGICDPCRRRRKRRASLPHAVDVPGRPVMGRAPIEEIDRALALPDRVVTTDGRILEVRRWQPSYELDGVVSVELEAIVKRSDELEAVAGQVQAVGMFSQECEPETEGDEDPYAAYAEEMQAWAAYAINQASLGGDWLAHEIFRKWPAEAPELHLGYLEAALAHWLKSADAHAPPAMDEARREIESLEAELAELMADPAAICEGCSVEDRAKQDRLVEAINAAAGDLPENWEIKIEVENGYGGVKLWDPRIEAWEDFDSEEDGMASDVRRALAHAIDKEARR